MMAAVRADLSKRLVPDELWELVARYCRRSRLDRKVAGPLRLTSGRCSRLAYILTSGCAWRYLPESFGVSPATAHRRSSVWTEAGLWRRLHRAVLDELGARGELDWSSVIVDAASVRAKRGAR